MLSAPTMCLSSGWMAPGYCALFGFCYGLDSISSKEMIVLPYIFFHSINYNTITIKGNVRESYEVKSSFSTLLLQISILYIEPLLV